MLLNLLFKYIFYKLFHKIIYYKINIAKFILKTHNI